MYDNSAAKPKPTLLDEFNPFDDFTLIPHDGLDRFDNVDQTITLDLKMANLGNGAN